jgi:hypothetical protein
MINFVVLALADADFADWITVAAYLLAAIFCWLAGRRSAATGHRKERRFWIISALALIFFGVNELLDLQTLISTVGRDVAEAGGWYEDRRPIQYAFVAALGLAALVFGLGLLRWTRAMSKAVRTALLGFVFIGVFILFRAASFHHLDQLLGSGFQAFNMGSIQEMIGIFIVGGAALFGGKGKAETARVKAVAPS